MSFIPGWLIIKSGPVPPPPELPKYDKNIEAPKWNWRRLYYTVDPVEPHPNRLKTGGVPTSDDQPDWRDVIKKNIIPLKPPERYNFGKHEPDHYFWFDTPDYADPFKKMKYATIFVTKAAIAGSGSWAIYRNLDFIMKNHVYLFKRVFSRMWIGGMTASLTVVTLANLRGNVDDIWNYVWGGIMAGAVVGRHNHLSFQRQTAMFTAAAVVVKLNAESNGKLIPTYNFRIKHHSMALGSGAEYGFWSGNIQPKYFRAFPDDPGRDPRHYPVG